MILVDAQLSPHLAPWMEATFGVEARAVRDVGLRNEEDTNIFSASRQPGIIVITKDIDFVVLLERMGPPPQVLWITCGNTSNEYLKGLLLRSLPSALKMLADGEPLVEIG